ncbi:hypothetical protein SLS60_010388 [Paraconiothyrium brasiliense]|uniref:Uncharacterized protein n=1 Tax=Paraconiothyrium brasiliense TaxID=300254 RepID=A0ABR3QS52_9PLEO
MRIDVEEFPSNDSDFLKSMAAELKGSSSADATRVNGIAALLRSQSIADNRRRSIGSIEKTLLKHYAKLVEAAKRSQRTCEEVEKNCLAGSASPQIADDLRKVADVLGSRASRLRKRLNSLFGRNAIAETG